METFKGWIEMQGRISKRQHAVIAYPIYLMLIRVAVETVMRNAVPSIFKGPKNEVQVLEKTERIVSAMLDPDGYLNYPLPAPPGPAAPMPPPANGAANGAAAEVPSTAVEGLEGLQITDTPFAPATPLLERQFSASTDPRLAGFMALDDLCSIFHERIQNDLRGELAIKDGSRGDSECEGGREGGRCPTLLLLALALSHTPTPHCSAAE